MRGLRVAAAEREEFQSRQMDDAIINPYDPRESECSGRALATLVIAWVGAALVASVLLKWTEMWVALAILTLLFLAACTYAAYDARKTHERALAREEERQLERARRRQEQLDSISNGIDNYPEVMDPPDYQTYWISDLPPSYNAVVGTQPPSAPTGSSTWRLAIEEGEGENLSACPRLSNPPPYAIAIQTEPIFLPVNSGGNQTVETPPPGSSPASTAPQQNVVLQSAVDTTGQTSSHGGVLNNNYGQRNNVSNNNNNNNNTTSRFSDTSSPIGDEDKIGNGRTNGNGNATIGLTRTQYLASIFNSTFGRAARRPNNNNNNNNNNNGDQNVAANGQTDGQNNRNRTEQTVVHNNTTNNGRNLNVNGGGIEITTSSQYHPTAHRPSDITFSNC